MESKKVTIWLLRPTPETTGLDFNSVLVYSALVAAVARAKGDRSAAWCSNAGLGKATGLCRGRTVPAALRQLAAAQLIDTGPRVACGKGTAVGNVP